MFHIPKCAAKTGFAIACSLGLAAGCGVPGPPRPLSLSLPSISALRATQIDADLWVSWQEPALGILCEISPIQGYTLRIARPLADCLHCGKEETERKILVDAADPLLRQEQQRLYYPIQPGAQHIRVAVVYENGLSPFAETYHSGADIIPQPQLRWEVLQGAEEAESLEAPESASETPQTAAAPRATQKKIEVRLYWQTEEEGRVYRYAISTAGDPSQAQPIELQRLHYRANIYRRMPKAPWPLTPLNPAPLRTTQWLLQKQKGGQKQEPLQKQKLLQKRELLQKQEALQESAPAQAESLAAEKRNASDSPCAVEPNRTRPPDTDSHSLENATTGEGLPEMQYMYTVRFVNQNGDIGPAATPFVLPDLQ